MTRGGQQALLGLAARVCNGAHAATGQCCWAFLYTCPESKLDALVVLHRLTGRYEYIVLDFSPEAMTLAMWVREFRQMVASTAYGDLEATRGAGLWH